MKPFKGIFTALLTPFDANRQVNEKELEKLVKAVEKQMKKAAADLNFEAAVELRDRMVELKKILHDMDE